MCSQCNFDNQMLKMLKPWDGMDVRRSLSHPLAENSQQTGSACIILLREQEINSCCIKNRWGGVGLLWHLASLHLFKVSLLVCVYISHYVVAPRRQGWQEYCSWCRFLGLVQYLVNIRFSTNASWIINKWLKWFLCVWSLEIFFQRWVTPSWSP